MDRMEKDSTGRFVKHDSPNLCVIKDCENPVTGRGMCNTHYLRLVRYGDPLFRKKRANGEGGISTQGYREITVNGKRMLEHRHVMETHLGRKLRRYEIVHHIDGNKQNNAIGNLEVLRRRDHPANHPEVLSSLKLGPKKRWGTM